MLGAELPQFRYHVVDHILITSALCRREIRLEKVEQICRVTDRKGNGRHAVFRGRHGVPCVYFLAPVNKAHGIDYRQSSILQPVVPSTCCSSAARTDVAVDIPRAVLSPRYAHFCPLCCSSNNQFTRIIKYQSLRIEQSASVLCSIKLFISWRGMTSRFGHTARLHHGALYTNHNRYERVFTKYIPVRAYKTGLKTCCCLHPDGTALLVVWRSHVLWMHL